jgi:hypothetical protein
MKKAKIMLSVIVIIAVISGTFAFKTHHKGTSKPYYFCSVTSGIAGTCKLTNTVLALGQRHSNSRDMSKLSLQF